ncbi:MAG: helix-turn-helix domain-containing protein [Candidatus Omnitrophota bacterium]|jgi:hypothetical protein
MMNNMLSLEEVKTFLETDQKAVEHYIQTGRLHAYKIGGSYLRFRKEEVLTLRQQTMSSTFRPHEAKGSFWTRIYDFWQFNNFYIISLVIVVTLALLVFRP